MENFSLKELLVNMFEDFDKFCKENNLRYFMVGGTQLGAVRHKGMIPWDDDIDVGMPRVDYERFLDLTEGKKIFSNYVVESFRSNNSDYIYPYAKMYNIHTTLEEEGWKPIKRGIYIDIFPLDGMGNTEKEAISHFKKVKFRYNLFCTMVCAINPQRSLFKNLSIYIGRTLTYLGISKERVFNSIDKLSKKYSYDESSYIALLVGNWGIKELHKREVFGSPRLYKFENLEVFGVDKYDDYLSRMYGDYMTPPPLEKRVSHHPKLEYSLEYGYMDEIH